MASPVERRVEPVEKGALRDYMNDAKSVGPTQYLS
jgi:hypothetical protein